MAAPTYVTTTISNSPVDFTATNAATARTTPSYSPGSGDVLVAAAVSDDAGGEPITSISGGPAWSQQYLDNTYNKCSVALYTATAAGGAITTAVNLNKFGNAFKAGVAVLQFTGSDGIGAKNTAQQTTGTPSVSLTTTQDNSAVVMVVGDWAAVTGTSAFSNVNSTPAEVVDYADGTNYAAHIAYWPDVGAAGAKTFAMSAPSGQNWTAHVIEIKGTAGGSAAALAAAAADTAASAAALSTAIRAAAGAFGQAGSSGALTTSPSSLSAAAAVAAASTVALTTQIRAAAAAGVLSGSTVALTTGILMGAAPQVIASAGPANLIAAIRFAAAPAAQVTATADIRPAVDLFWDAPGDWTPAGYRVKWGTSSGSYTSQQDVGAGVLTTTLWGLASNTVYYWIVVGLNGLGEEQTPSAEATFNTLPGASFAAAPSSVAGATAALTTAIRLGASAADIAQVTAALGALAALAAAAQGLPGSTAALTSGIQLAAVTAGLAQVTAALTTVPSGLAASAAAQAAASATLTGSSASLGAAALALSTASVQLTTQIRLVAAAADQSGASATLAGGAAALTAAAQGQAASFAVLTTGIELAAAAAGLAQAIAALDTAPQAASLGAAAQVVAAAGAEITTQARLVVHRIRPPAYVDLSRADDWGINLPTRYRH